MVRLITLTRAWRWLQLEGRFRAEVSEKAVTNGTFHVVWTRARVRLWPPRPKTSIAACSVICPRTSAIARSIAVPARDKLIFACAATAFTIALHADRRAATRFRTSGNHKFASTGISLNGVRVALTSRRLSWGRPARTGKRSIVEGETPSRQPARGRRYTGPLDNHGLFVLSKHSSHCV